MEKKDKPQVYNENHMENCNVFQGDIYGATFPLPGAQVTIHQNYGKGQKPTQDVTAGRVETAEEREKRKTEVIKANYQMVLTLPMSNWDMTTITRS